MNYSISMLISFVVVFSVTRAAICQSDRSSSPPPESDAQAVEALATTAADLVAVQASVAAMQAEIGPSASDAARPHRYYLATAPMEHSFRLFRLNLLERLPWIRNQTWANEAPDVERFFWYASAPAVFLLKGVPLYAATGNLTVSIILPLLFFLPKYFTMLMMKTAMRLQAHSWIVEQWHLSSVDDGIPGLTRILRLTGQAMKTRARVADALVTRNYFILEVDADTPRFPPEFTIDVPQNGKIVESSLIEIPSIESTKFEFSLRGVPDEDGLPKWTLDFDSLERGLRVPENIRKVWWQSAEHHFSTATINTKMLMGRKEIDIGPLVSLQGVANLLGHKMSVKDLFMFLFGVQTAIHNGHIKNLQERIENPELQVGLIYTAEELKEQLPRVMALRDRIKSWEDRFASVFRGKVKLKSSKPSPPLRWPICDLMLTL